MPFVSHNKYKIFEWGKEYYIDDKCIEKLKNLEGYRDFIWSYKAPLIIPIILLSTLIAGIISLIIKDFNNMQLFTVRITVVIYIIISYVYYIKLKKAIKCNENDTV